MNKTRKLDAVLAPAQKGGFAVGSFSSRYIRMIPSIIRAAQQTESPAIVQVSEKEIYRHALDLNEFAQMFYRTMAQEQVDIPVALHLDHTKDLAIIRQAVEVGFTSVMIDASEHPFEKNAEITRQVVSYAHQRGVCVEAELGKIGTTDFAETDHNEERFTDPEEAAEFCRITGVDALAVSVGTAHGPYTTTKPTIAYERLRAINALTDTPLVLHGASGVPSEMVVQAARLETGGVCKVNIATDLEMAMMAVLGRSGHMKNQELEAYSEALLKEADQAVQALVEEKIRNYLCSAGQARRY